MEEDYPLEIRSYTKSGCPFSPISDRRHYDHWYHYKIRKPRIAKKAIVKVDK